MSVKHVASSTIEVRGAGQARPDATDGQPISARARPAVVVIGPTPPPFHGMAVYTRMLVSSSRLAQSYRVLHLDTSDRRSLDNMGRLDARNVALALRHAAALRALLRRERPQVVYIELSQNALAFLRDAVLVQVARLHGCAVAAHLHGSDFQAFYRRS